MVPMVLRIQIASVSFVASFISFTQSVHRVGFHFILFFFRFHIFAFFFCIDEYICSHSFTYTQTHAYSVHIRTEARFYSFHTAGRKVTGTTIYQLIRNKCCTAFNYVQLLALYETTIESDLNVTTFQNCQLNDWVNDMYGFMHLTICPWNATIKYK